MDTTNTQDGPAAGDDGRPLDVRLHVQLTGALSAKGEYAAELARMAIEILGAAGWLERFDLVGGLEKLELGEDDIIVVRLDQQMTQAASARMAAQLRAVTGHATAVVFGDTVLMSAQSFVASLGASLES